MEYSSMFDLITLGCGIYLMVTWFKLHTAGRLFPNSLLIPKDKSVKDCLDAPAYVAYISPRLLIVGVVITISGVLGVVNALFQLYGIWVAMSITGVAFATLVWFAVCSARAMKRYW